MRINKLESNSRVDKHLYHNKVLSCSFCPPNSGENTKRKNQHQKTHKSWKLGRRKQYQNIL